MEAGLMKKISLLSRTWRSRVMVGFSLLKWLLTTAHAQI